MPFFNSQKVELSQARPLSFPKIFLILGIQKNSMAKLHFRPYIPSQTLLFPNRMDEDIAANDPVRIVNALVDSLDLSGIKALYKEYGRSPCAV
jgi:transposase